MKTILLLGQYLCKNYMESFKFLRKAKSLDNLMKVTIREWIQKFWSIFMITYNILY
jgi:hypothetical protein